jgi:AbiV family abortive infection protein
MLAREEYGKARRLFALAAEGQDVDANDVVITRHIDKQRLALVSVMLPSSDSESSLVESLREMSAHKIGTVEWTEAARAFAAAMEPIVGRLPQDRHRARMRSLYVDWDSTTGRWLRPEMTADEARHQLDHAINDYTTHERNIDVDMTGTLGGAVAALLDAWPQRPTLPASQRPKWW